MTLVSRVAACKTPWSAHPAIAMTLMGGFRSDPPNASEGRLVRLEYEHGSNATYPGLSGVDGVYQAQDPHETRVAELLGVAKGTVDSDSKTAIAGRPARITRSLSMATNIRRPRSR